MTEPASIRYGGRRKVPQDAPCEACGGNPAIHYSDHCHEHGWIRGLVCHRCNILLGLIDKRIAPKAEAGLLAALIAIRNRCPGCGHLNVSDLKPACEVPAATRFPRELYEWLRAEAFETRESMNSIIVAAVEERRMRARLRGKQVNHKDGDPRNNDPSNLELREDLR